MIRRTEQQEAPASGERVDVPDVPAQARPAGSPDVPGRTPPADVPDLPAQTRPAEAPDMRVPPRPSLAGAVLSDRYRLQLRVGGDTAAGAEFWRASDRLLQRDVAVTVLRRGAPRPAADDATGARAGEIVARALRSGSFDHPGCARLLDVLAPGAPGLPEEVLGAAVTEWVPGRSLAEHVADGLLKPRSAARALQALSAAAEEAHRHGFVLGCDHPQRIRVTPDGRARLCFALPRLDLMPADDVRGLGAVLFTLLTSRWPLSGTDAARAGLRAADRGPDGAPAAPSALRPGVPVELDALAVGTLGGTPSAYRVHTAAAVRRLLDEVVAEDDRLALFPPVPDGVPAGPEDVWQDDLPPSHDPVRRRNLRLGLAALAAGFLLVSVYVGSQVTALFSDPSEPTIVVGAPPVPAPAAPAPPPADEAAGTGAVEVSDVEVFDAVGDRDNAGLAPAVVDGDPASTWRTFVYRQPFPALKPGVGLMVSFESAVQLSGLTVDSPSEGSRIEVRSAPTADATLDETVLLTDATLEDGRTVVSLSDIQPVDHLLIWITDLGGGGSENITEIREVEFRSAGL